MLKIKQLHTFLHSNSWGYFLLFTCILLISRYLILNEFSFVYTDYDQIILWNGALDYSQGIFHEPFFYGQSYNYMLEAFLAVPLIWVGIPPEIALPTTTSILALFPFVFFAALLKKRNYSSWAYLCLTLPIILPVEYSMLTSLSRGFVQAHLFIPFLFLPLFSPQNKKYLLVLFVFSALSFVANQSSVIFILPLIIYVGTYHYQHKYFYLKALVALPFLLINYLAKYFYELQPKKNYYTIEGIYLHKNTFFDSLMGNRLFEFIVPFGLPFGLLFLIFFIFLTVISFKKKRLFLFLLSFTVFLLLTISIPKVQWNYEGGGIFYSPSRFYTLLPLFGFVFSFLLFKNRKLPYGFILILSVCILSFTYKNYELNNQVATVLNNSVFPKAKLVDLKERVENLYETAKENHASLIIAGIGMHSSEFDGYSFYPLTNQNEIIMLKLNKDRRSWLYQQPTIHQKVLLHGFEPIDKLTGEIQYEKLRNNLILLKNNSMNNKDLTLFLQKE